VIDTARGSRRIARETRQAQAAGSPRNRGIFDPKLLRGALGPAIRKMDPRALARNPVMFVVEVTAALVTAIFLSDLIGLTHGAAREVGRAPGFEFQIAVWLWFTVYFATYAEALAEARARPRRRPCARPVPRRRPIAAATTARSRRSAPRRCVPAT